MNIVELQILFQQKLKDIDPSLDIDQRLDTFTIANYLNKSIDRHLQEKYLMLPTFEQRLAAIDFNQDELRMLIKGKALPTDYTPTSSEAWQTYGERFLIDEDILTPISLSVNRSRNEIYAGSNEAVFCDLVSRRQAERILTTASDHPMYPKPLAIWLNKYHMIVIGDAYTTAITNPYLVYLKKPFTLSFNYTEITTEGANNISAIPVNSYFIVHSRCSYYNDLFQATVYDAGSKVRKLNGYNTVTVVDDDLKIGYPYGEIDTPEFPEYMHDGIVDKAISIYLDEAKFKLIAKAQ